MGYTKVETKFEREYPARMNDNEPLLTPAQRRRLWLVLVPFVLVFATLILAPFFL